MNVKSTTSWAGVGFGSLVGLFLLWGQNFSIHPAYKPPVAAEAPDSPTQRTVEVGELVVLKVAGNSVVWFSEPAVATVTYGAENENCVVAFRKPGTYLIFSAAIDEATDVEVRRVEVVVQGAEPVVVDPVDPVTPVDPTLARLVAFAGPDKAAVSASFRAVAAQLQTKVDAGVLVTPAQIVAITAESNRRAVAGREPAWRAFFVELEHYIAAAAPKTVTDHVVLWKQIASALEK